VAEIDFFDKYIVPFATGTPELADAIRKWPLTPEVARQLIDFSKIRPENNVVLSLHIAKFTNAANNGLSAQIKSRNHITMVAQGLYTLNQGSYPVFRDAVLEFMADSPNNLTYFKVLFANIEAAGITGRLGYDKKGPSEPT
jgi:hypothetical protein